MIAALVLAAVSIPLSAVQPGASGADAPASVVATQPARWNWTKGARTRYTVTQTTETSAEGMIAYDLKQTQTQIVAVEVEDVTASGEASLKLTLESIRISTIPTKGAKPVEVSSEAAASNEEFDPSGACRALAGLSLTIVVAADGTIREIRGTPAVKDRVKAALAQPTTLANLAADALGGFDEIQLRSRIESALLLEPKEPRGQPAPVTFRGLGTLLADQSVAATTQGTLVVVHGTTDFSLRTPNTDEITSQFEVDLSEARQESESTLDPAAGVVRKVASTLTMTTVLTPKAASAALAKTTRRLTQTLSIEPANASTGSGSGADGRPVTPPGAPEKP